MKFKFNVQKFGEELAMFRITKKKMTAREVQSQIGVAASTISRCERGIYLPDMITFGKLCSWMNKEPNIFFKK